jgi:ATP-binding cassette subfamily B protein
MRQVHRSQRFSLSLPWFSRRAHRSEDDDAKSGRLDTTPARGPLLEGQAEDLPSDRQAPGKGPFGLWRTALRLSPFVRPHGKAIVLALVMMLGEAAMGLLKPWPLKLTFDHILLQPSLAGPTLYALVGVSALVVAIAVFEGLWAYLAAFFLNRAGRTIVLDLRIALFEHLQRLSLRFHHRKSSGDVMARVTGDVKAFQDVLTESVAEILKSLLFLAGMGVVLLWLDWQLTLVLVGATPLLLLALVAYMAKIQSRAQAERKREGAVASLLHEWLGTVRLARVFNQEETARQRFQVQSAASLQRGLAATLASERFSWVVDIIGGLVTAGVLGFGVFRVMAGAITAGTLIVFVSYVRNLYKSLRTAAKHMARTTKASAGVERVVRLLEVQDQLVDSPGARPAPRLHGLIEFRDVHFEYEPGRPVLHGIDLTIPPGQITALVGPTGCGKSTLVSLIPRLYDPTRGAVLIDGHDIRGWTLHSLRSQISVVLQESVLLQASIAENIAYGCPNAGTEEIEAAARAANAHDFILELPEGYDTEVGERGETLSGGQRQRISIARAIVRATPIVILDEPLTGLDAVAEATVVEALERLMKDKTVILISHHLSLVERADHVVVLVDGQVAQRGRPRDLVLTEGTYRRLFQSQDGAGLGPGCEALHP